MGNDVVDLRTDGACGKSRDRRFVRRVFTASEQNRLAESQYPDACLWAMWAAKEAAYKAVSRIFPDSSAWPGRYEMVFDQPGLPRDCAGTVSTPEGPVRVRLHWDENRVHCLGLIDSAGLWQDLTADVLEPCADAHPEIQPSAKQLSAAARIAAAAAICLHTGLPHGLVSIERTRVSQRSAPPVVKINGIEEKIPVSLSHHGRFAAFAFLAPLQSGSAAMCS
ncbi:MAG: 4'-phosphopantetheinyl transferase superfamily protein [Desulfosalsimonas sp.]|uniref:4'-phosphopantetheinyl transferase superfamily protein n=1 Tax=Desulfosalsimonas sp. TaxID=3073848 RepID=UPI003970DE9D